MSIGAVSILGNGNAAWQLAQQFHIKGIVVAHIFTRNQEEGERLAELVQSQWKPLDGTLTADTLFLCLPEDAVSKVVREHTIEAIHVLHCSGSLPMSALQDFASYGVFYPLQTMTKGRLLTADQMPICIEASNTALEADLVTLAQKVGFPWTQLDSALRKKAHVSAVMVNNFSNHLWHLAAQLAEANEVDGTLYGPLLMETLHKFLRLGGKKAQTGPARRGDTQTIAEHLDLLKEQPNVGHIYQLFTESIRNEFK